MGTRIHPIFTNFRMGEISPKLYGRVDWERYQNGCVVLENMIIQPQGGVTRRPGTRYVATVKDSSARCRLVPFKVDDDNVFVLELGNLYVRFYKNGAPVMNGLTPYELVSPWATAILPELHYGQAEETLVFTHRTVPPYRLTRFSDTQWRLSPIAFDPPPSREVGTVSTASVGGDLTPSATTGTNIRIDGTQYIFLAADVGREILDTASGSRASIVTVDSQTRVHVDILDDFPSTATILAGNWKLDGSPLTAMTPSAASPVGQSITLSLDVGGWRAEDVGKYVVANGGVVELTGFTSAFVMTGTIIRELESTTAQPAQAWSLEEAAWSPTQGYPATVAFFEGRMLMGGPSDRFYMSASFNYFDYSLGSTDDAAISYRTTSGDRSSVRWFSPRRQLLMGTTSDEVVLTGGNDAAITPTNIRVRPGTPHGSSYLTPIRSEHATLFVPSNGRLLRELAYAYEVDDYRAPNLLDTAEHLTLTEAIEEIAFQRPPDSIIWAVRSDGVLLGCTYLREQDLVGWHRHVTDGDIESVCCIPSTDGTTEQAWLLVNRTIGGATKRYVEYMDSQDDLHWAAAPGLQTDSAVTYEGAATTTVTGLSHLEGKAVQIVGDGAVYPPATVSGGAVSLSGAAAGAIEVGLPFTSTVQTVRPEVPEAGTSQGRPKAWPEVKVRLLNSIGGKVNGQILTSPTPPVLFTGDKKIAHLGWDADAWITVTQEQPLPMTVLAIFGALAVGE